MSDEADKSLRQTHREFREWYASNLPFCKALADTAHDYLEERLTDAGIPVHAVFARSKDPLTLMEKVRRKGYVSPREEVTDLVGARVIVQYLDEVEPAASLVRHALVDIDEAHSIDKGKTLATREFGYRSIHIVAKLPVEVLDIRGLPREPSLGVEVQVRTIFEHAWAEIEHEVVYKSGIRYPDDFRRRFSAVAGTLEILEREFMLMRSFRRDLIDEHKEKYQSLKELKQSFDAARLIAYFEVSRSSGRGWRRAEAEGNPFARNSEARCVEVLHYAQLSTPDALSAWLDNSNCQSRLEAYAAGIGFAPDEIPHYAVALLAAASKDNIVLEQFPELYQDVTLRGALVNE